MGSRSEKKQPGALVGEKSQTVFSANWKLDVMLLKNLQMLDVSKHRVSHRISMDQRVVNKRFQTKLHRSKITHARMTNNRELLRELIHRDNYTFNTSVGGQDEKYTVKISPTHTPNEDKAINKETLKYGNGKGIRPAATPIVVVEPNADEAQNTSAVYKPGSDLCRGNKRPSGSASPSSKTISGRPPSVATSPKQDSQATLQTDTRLNEETANSHFSDSLRGHTSQRLLATTRKLRPTTAMPGLSKTTSTTKTKPNRPKTAAARQDSRLLTTSSPDGQSSLQTPVTSATSRPTSGNQRPISAAPRRRTPPSKQKHAMPSIFGEDKRPTILDINSERLLRANFPNRVKHFAGTLKGLQTDPKQTVDYYTLRLLENLQCPGRKGPREFIESEAERRDAERSIGNLDALNMTFGNVKKVDTSDNLANPVKARLNAWESDGDSDDAGLLSNQSII